MCRADLTDEWKTFHTETRIARKHYSCYECGREIRPGESYVRTSGVMRGEQHWDVIRLCAHCDWASKWLSVQCGGFIYGEIYEDLLEHWREGAARGIGFGRVLVLMRRRWLDNDRLIDLEKLSWN